jgi:transposase
MPYLLLHQRYEIIFLHEHPHGPQWGYEKIAAHIGCTKSAVAYWVQRWKISNDLSDQEKTGRRRSTTEKDDERIVKLAKTEHDITAAQIQQKMENKNINVSIRTIRRRLCKAGAKYTNEISKPLLKEKHREKRLEWAKQHQNFDWKQVIFTDESTFRLFPMKKKVWQFIDRKKLFVRLSIRKGFTCRGVFRLWVW